MTSSYPSAVGRSTGGRRATIRCRKKGSGVVSTSFHRETTPDPFLHYHLAGLMHRLLLGVLLSDSEHGSELVEVPCALHPLVAHAPRPPAESEDRRVGSVPAEVQYDGRIRAEAKVADDDRLLRVDLVQRPEPLP